MLRQVVGQRARHRVLQEHFVGLQPVAVNRFHLSGVEVHRDDADGQKHAQNDVKNRDSRRIRRGSRRFTPLTCGRGAVDRGGGGFHGYLLKFNWGKARP